jgi:hypothetical protein
MWVVLMEEGWGNVIFYPFDSGAAATEFWEMVRRDRPSRPRIYFDLLGSERFSAGWCPVALRTIRNANKGSVSMCGECSLGLEQIPEQLEG